MPQKVSNSFDKSKVLWRTSWENHLQRYQTQDCQKSMPKEYERVFI